MLKVRIFESIGDFTLDVDLVLSGEGVTAIYGPSGSGKTTLLRCIAGLIDASVGEVVISDVIWRNEANNLPTCKRSIGYVFQGESLLRHLDVESNLAYALKRSSTRLASDDIEHIYDILELRPLLQRKPSALSGGEYQRVAIARALLINPSLILMDEPLASLDNSRKREIIPYLKRVNASLNVPILYVSHSLDEIAQLADYIVVLRAGKVTVQGELKEVLSRLEGPLISDLDTGQDLGAVLDVVVSEKEQQWGMDRVSLYRDSSVDGIDVWLRDTGLPVGSKVRVRILAKDISLATQRHTDTSVQNILPSKVEGIADDVEKGFAIVRLRLGNDALLARVTKKSVAQLELTQGQLVWAQIKSVALLQ